MLLMGVSHHLVESDEQFLGSNSLYTSHSLAILVHALVSVQLSVHPISALSFACLLFVDVWISHSVIPSMDWCHIHRQHLQSNLDIFPILYL